MVGEYQSTSSTIRICNDGVELEVSGNQQWVEKMVEKYLQRSAHLGKYPIPSTNKKE